MNEEKKSISPKLDAKKDAPNANSQIGRIIAVISGKGGVGKSTVSSVLACALRRRGKRVGIMDADVTGPSIPKLFGLEGRLYGDEEGNIVPPTSGDIPIVSTNLMLESPTQAVAWRGPVVSGVLKQFFGQTNWGQLDYLIVDMPPGTSDVALTVFQSLPVDGIVVVTAPQDLVEMIVDKAIDLAGSMGVPVLGLVENMAAFTCPDCGSLHYIYGEPKGARLAQERGISAYAMLPLDPRFANLADAGKVSECVLDDELAPLLDQIVAIRYDFE